MNRVAGGGSAIVLTFDGLIRRWHWHWHWIVTPGPWQLRSDAFDGSDWTRQHHLPGRVGLHLFVGQCRARTSTNRWTVCAWRGVVPLARHGLQGGRVMSRHRCSSAQRSSAAQRTVLGHPGAAAAVLGRLWRDARAGGRNPWPWMAATLVVGSFWLLDYLLTPTAAACTAAGQRVTSRCSSQRPSKPWRRAWPWPCAPWP